MAGSGATQVVSSSVMATPTTTAQQMIIILNPGQPVSAVSGTAMMNAGSVSVPLSLQQSPIQSPAAATSQGVALRFLPYRR
jgi:hypothetical protein